MSININDSPLDKEIEARLLSMMKDRPSDLLIYFLVIAGQTMEEANAAQMDLNTKSTINGKRYKVYAKFTIKQVSK